MSDRFENDDTHTLHPDWIVESRVCPFDDLPARFCGCPEGERIMDESHLVRGVD